MWRRLDVEMYGIGTGVWLHVPFWVRCDVIGLWEKYVWDWKWDGWELCVNECVLVIFYVVDGFVKACCNVLGLLMKHVFVLLAFQCVL